MGILMLVGDTPTYCLTWLCMFSFFFLFLCVRVILPLLPFAIVI